MREVKKNCIMRIEDTRDMTITNLFLMTTKIFVLSFIELTAVLLAESGKGDRKKCWSFAWHKAVTEGLVKRGVICYCFGLKGSLYDAM